MAVPESLGSGLTLCRDAALCPGVTAVCCLHSHAAHLGKVSPSGHTSNLVTREPTSSHRHPCSTQLHCACTVELHRTRQGILASWHTHTTPSTVCWATLSSGKLSRVHLSPNAALWAFAFGTPPSARFLRDMLPALHSPLLVRTSSVSLGPWPNLSCHQCSPGTQTPAPRYPQVHAMPWWYNWRQGRWWGYASGVRSSSGLSALALAGSLHLRSTSQDPSLPCPSSSLALHGLRVPWPWSCPSRALGLCSPSFLPHALPLGRV